MREKRQQDVRLASRFDWHERAIAFDNYHAEQLSRQLVARRAQAQARQADRAGVLSDTAMLAVRRLVGRLQADQNAELTPADITHLFGTASKVEASALQFGGDKGLSVAVGMNVKREAEQLEPGIDCAQGGARVRVVSALQKRHTAHSAVRARHEAVRDRTFRCQSPFAHGNEAVNRRFFSNP